jgi:hypothetical protein
MNAGWVACSVRARAMTRRRLGRVPARRLAAQPSLEAALARLAATPYEHEVGPGQTLAAAQRAAVQSVLWDVRVLAGWAPREGVTMLRVLAGPLEAANVADHLQALSGGAAPMPYRLGRLSTAWPRVAETRTADDVRQVLRSSPWGDPGSAAPRDVALAMRLTAADRIIATVARTTSWATAASALLVARETVLGARELPASARTSAERVLGRAALAAGALPGLAAALPLRARWALEGVADPQDLWRAELRWWSRVERDAFALVRRPKPGPDVLVGAVALLAVDAWRVRAALELAARGGGSAEALDAVA